MAKSTGELLKTDMAYVKSRVAGSEEIAVMNQAICNHLD